MAQLDFTFAWIVLEFIATNKNKPAYELVDYKIKGNRLILKRNKSKANVIEVRNGGEMLVLATDDLNVMMHKIY